MTGTVTGSLMSRQSALKILSPDLARKLMTLLVIPESDILEEGEGAKDVHEEDILQHIVSHKVARLSGCVRYVLTNPKTLRNLRCTWTVTQPVQSVEKG